MSNTKKELVQYFAGRDMRLNARAIKISTYLQK